MQIASFFGYRSLTTGPLEPAALSEYNKYKYYPLNLEPRGVSRKAGRRADERFLAVHHVNQDIYLCNNQ
jgi:hypothetical protein